MAYELWDTETRNMIGTFELKVEALGAARELIAVNSSAYPGAPARAFEDDEGETKLVASGLGPAERAAAQT